jgi:hypothetical protein
MVETRTGHTEVAGNVSGDRLAARSKSRAALCVIGSPAKSNAQTANFSHGPFVVSVGSWPKVSTKITARVCAHANRFLREVPDFFFRIISSAFTRARSAKRAIAPMALVALRMRARSSLAASTSAANTVSLKLIPVGSHFSDIASVGVTPRCSSKRCAASRTCSIRSRISCGCAAFALCRPTASTVKATLSPSRRCFLRSGGTLSPIASSRADMSFSSTLRGNVIRRDVSIFLSLSAGGFHGVPTSARIARS